MRRHQVRRIAVVQGDIDDKGVRRGLFGKLVCRAAIGNADGESVINLNGGAQAR